MTYETPAAIRQALEQRLRERASEGGGSIVRLRKSVAFDRVLARLMYTAPDRWVLKGALALDLRLTGQGRTTKDIDLVRRDEEAAAIDDLLAAQEVDLGDRFVVSIERIARVGNEGEALVSRFRAVVELAGRPFEEVLIDVGFADPLGWDPEELPGTDLLMFAGYDRIVVPALPLEQQIAEKVHAYTRSYGDGRSSSRVKDLIDLMLIAREAGLDAARLSEAIEVTFQGRGMQPMPERFPRPPPDWTVPYRALAREAGIDTTLADAHASVATFLDPALSRRAEGTWDPLTSRWR